MYPSYYAVSSCSFYSETGHEYLFLFLVCDFRQPFLKFENFTKLRVPQFTQRDLILTN